jgi:hypothetical protein
VAQIQIESYFRDSLCRRMCVVDAVRNSRGFHLGGKGALPGMAVPRSGVGGWGPGMGLAGFDEGEDGHEEG